MRTKTEKRGEFLGFSHSRDTKMAKIDIYSRQILLFRDNISHFELKVSIIFEITQGSKITQAILRK